ncbi:YpjP family protein [Sporosarcina highlanderae]|uniref:YpjP family protein n=1 Tax=Sporosarcina highlanderae TaxID=3035916 RepID=A0ABT8JTE6_9BACL|nr:YpjP family protein [Sporosarcina highlanderae]MDN4607652.1 YpjP family protein [Sporosarcina highlanderae]
MKKYFQKLFIAIVAVLTLGVISPSHEIWTTLQPKDDTRETDLPSLQKHGLQLGLEDSIFEREIFAQTPSIEEILFNPAKELVYLKFGSRIGPVIKHEFDQVIFPKMSEVIESTVASAGGLDNGRISITETPSGNYAEKIFHVSDTEAKKDLIRFHVRTEKRPQDGYFYNFHYHTADDDFTVHHSLGDIYWSKNTPPKWLS